jgi:ABC-2 type transport system ATP-binding protein
MSAVIECEHVTKSYGDIVAVNDISLNIEEGEIFGLVGPNGAGKTTLIEMIEGLRTPDSGFTRVLGLDPAKDTDELHEKIGVQLQTTSIQPNIKVKEAIKLFASLYRQPLNHPEELLKTLSLQDKADSRFRKLSGGQKQRVAIALALVNNPAVLFFDEITTGLDPQARRNMWALVKDIRGQGKTIFLTTHYMEEAEELCDRVGVIDHGKIIALDTPKNLISSLSADSKVLFKVENKEVQAAEFRELPAVSRVEKVEGGFILYTRDGDATIQELVRFADRQGFRLSNIHIEIPNLDDVFLTITGRELRE